jgi:uncharacterized protein (DUF302 family)
MYFFVRTSNPRPSFHRDMTDGERSTMTTHVEYWTERAAEGISIVFGPVADPKGAYGIGVYKVEDAEEMQTLLDRDPAAGLLQFESTPMAAAVIGWEVQHPELADAGVVTKRSPHSVAETVRRLEEIIDQRGLKLFTIVDHSGEAAHAGLDMPETKVIIFGSPAAGTPVMVARPLAALDLPLKVLVWADSNGDASVSYSAPEFIARRYALDDELTKRLRPIEAIVDAAIGTTS